MFPCTIQAHFSARNSNFDFQKYIEQSLEEDFRIIVSIRLLLANQIIFYQSIHLISDKTGVV